ncbi:hypothetical protein [uncultured Maricaulis sp.]|uniref:hypothetical protein n=1 Tax=uncultured Maricaulis sp. TaxID=174710 RepID=UPI0030DC974E|tara:strand:- start:1365 stop:1766 length:402 start_codon:yes stop_codon:yes gene_type:complete
MGFNFKERAVAEKLKAIAARDQSNPTTFPQNPTGNAGTLGIVKVRLHDDVPAHTGGPTGTPGKLDDCEVWFIDPEDDSYQQLDDENGDPLKITVYHDGPKVVAGTDADENAVEVFCAWHAGRWVIIVDYCRDE